MSDSSIPRDLVDQSTHTDTVKLRQAEERLQARFQEQSEWYRLRMNTSLCDCSNCINARELKAADVCAKVARRPPVVALPKQPDIWQRKISDIRSLFRFLLPSDEAIATSDEAIATSHIYS